MVAKVLDTVVSGALFSLLQVYHQKDFEAAMFKEKSGTNQAIAQHRLEV